MDFLVDQKSSENGKKYHVSNGLVKRTINIVLRNALYTIAGRILFGILKRLVKRGFKVNLGKILFKELFSLDPFKWAFILSGFPCFRLVKEMILNYFCNFFVTEKVAAALSGFICALPAFVMNKETKVDLSLYVFVRSLFSFGSGYILPRLPKKFQEFEHYDILIMCLSASQILYSVVYAPFTMPPSYQEFLSRASMMDNRVVRGRAGLSRYQITPELVELCLEKGFEIPRNPREHLKVGCLFTHPGMGCNQFYFSFIVKNMLQVGLPLYFPLKLGTVIAFQRKELKRKPLKIIRGIFQSVISSALFLALYSASTVRFACFTAQGNIRGGLFFAITCSLAGIAALLEPKGRRMDLAQYCLVYALRSFVMTQYRFGWIPYPRHGAVFFLYLLSLSFLFFQYDQDPEKLNPRLFSIFAKLLGEKDSSKRIIKSNEEEKETKRSCSNK